MSQEKQAADNDKQVTWEAAFQAELELIKERRADSSEKDLAGLAFSGGGIRSATFGLGVLEGLRNCGFLSRFDYLSTVSGGGYIGAWLSANCKRARQHNEPDWLDKGTDWSESTKHLRRYSNYLSPDVGFFSADTWSIATIWLRNTLLVQLTVILAIALALLAPRPLFVAFEAWPQVGDWRWTTILLFVLGVVGIAGNQRRVNYKGNARFLEDKSWLKGLGIAAVCIAIAYGIGVAFNFTPFPPHPVKGETNYRAAGPIAILLVIAGFSLQPTVVKLLHSIWRGKNPPKEINYTQAWVQGVVVVPMMAVGFLVAAILWGHSQKDAGELALLDTYGGFIKNAWKYWPFPLSVVFMSLLVLSFCSIRKRDLKGILAALAAPTVAMGVLHALLCAIMLLLHEWVTKGTEGKWLAYIWTPSFVLYAFSLTIVILIGILGRQSSEGGREWWSRFGAWLAIYGFAWTVVSIAAVYGPQWVAMLVNPTLWTGVVGGGWVGSTLAGLFAGNSGSTGKKGTKSTGAKIMEIVAAVAPFVFIAGLLIGVATVLQLIITINSDLPWSGAAQLSSKHWDLLTNAKLPVVWAVIGGCFLALLLMALRVDINEFGLNAFYRSRLIRCYLGATRFRVNDNRKPQNFTGFDDADDLKLAEFVQAKPPGPLHIVNCALNLGGSSDLALHTRHSAIFTMTPLYCGSFYRSHYLDRKTDVELGFVPTRDFGGKDGQPTLGQAISVSGAAASPNMGYHTSPVVAFLLTLFNVRLAWWFPNPRGNGIGSPSPWFSLRYLVMELFGGADDKSNFLAISDGGHFENLAAYELVKRKCSVIVISDAECDPELHFEGLGTLIRMCAVDFGATIDIDVTSLPPIGDPSWSPARSAIGTIYYDDGSQGKLIYLKASMTGGEHTDVLQYKSAHPTFPHESTGNQFYKEDQFESYRTLGRDIAMEVFCPFSGQTISSVTPKPPK